MVKVLVSRTSNCYWYEIKTFTLKSLLAFTKEKGELVLQENMQYGREPIEICSCWPNLSLEDAKQISECEFEVEIYDDYRE